MKWLIPLFLVATASAQWSGGVVSGGTITFTSGSLFGPPTYLGSCSSLAAISPPVIAPFSGFSGANNLVNDPEPVSGGNSSGCFHNPTMRLTDGNTASGANMIICGGGSGDENMISPDDKYLCTQTSGGTTYIWNFNIATMQGTLKFSGAGLHIPKGGNFNYSNANPDLFYSFANAAGNGYGPILQSSDMSSVSTPTPVTLFDLSSDTKCLGGSVGTIDWADPADVSKDDQSFTGAFSDALQTHGSVTSGTFTFGETVTQASSGAMIIFEYINNSGFLIGNTVTGSPNSSSIWTGGTSGATFTPITIPATVGQGFGIYSVVWNRTKGCIKLNMATGQVTADSGWGVNPGGTGGNPAGTGYICGGSTPCTTENSNLHNNKMMKNGDVLIATQTCLTTCTNNNSPYVWHVTTNPLSLTPVCTLGGTSYQCSGHWTSGYGVWANNNQSVIGQWSIRSENSPSGFTNILSSFPSNLGNGPGGIFDQHAGWSNVDSLNSNCFFTTTNNGNFDPPYTYGWDDEILCIFPGSGVVKRIGHAYSRAGNNAGVNFNAIFNIGSVSSSGKLYMWQSTMNDQLSSADADWQGTHSYTSGAVSSGVPTAQIMPLLNNPNNFTFVDYTAGTASSGSSEPNWNSVCGTPGSTCPTDGAITWVNAGYCVPGGGNWLAGNTYTVGQFTSPTAASNTGNFVYQITTPGTSSSTQPTWSAGTGQQLGGTETDSNGVVYTNRGIPDCRVDVFVVKAQ